MTSQVLQQFNDNDDDNDDDNDVDDDDDNGDWLMGQYDMGEGLVHP